MKEIWKEIEGFEGLYQVSNFGRIVSLKYIFPRVRKLVKISSGHLLVQLCNNGIKKTFPVHQLVAQAFISNPENKPEVHHIDGNPANNAVDNLMWVTRKEHKALHNIAEQNKITKSKRVGQYSLDGELIKEWPSTREIERQLGYNRGSISSCCLNRPKYKSAYNFIWKYL